MNRTVTVKYTKPCNQTVAIERRAAQGVETYVVSDVGEFARLVNQARRRK